MTAKEIRSIAIPCGIGLVLMSALALGFRLSIRRQQDEKAQSANRAEEASESSSAACAVAEPIDPPERCLVKPLAEWRPDETNAYPSVRAWLEARSRKILPWEWSDEAIAKSPDGYCALWAELAWELQLKLMARETVAWWTGRPAAGVEAAAAEDPLAEIARLRCDYEREAARGREDAASVTSARLREAEGASARALVRVLESVDRARVRDGAPAVL